MNYKECKYIKQNYNTYLLIRGRIATAQGRQGSENNIV